MLTINWSFNSKWTLSCSIWNLYLPAANESSHHEWTHVQNEWWYCGLLCFAISMMCVVCWFSPDLRPNKWKKGDMILIHNKWWNFIHFVFEQMRSCTIKKIGKTQNSLNHNIISFRFIFDLDLSSTFYQPLSGMV